MNFSFVLPARGAFGRWQLFAAAAAMCADRDPSQAEGPLCLPSDYCYRNGKKKKTITLTPGF